MGSIRKLSLVGWCIHHHGVDLNNGSTEWHEEETNQL